MRFAVDDNELWAQEEDREHAYCDGCGQQLLDFDDEEMFDQPRPWYCASCDDALEEEWAARTKSINWFGEDYT